jgi:hypothetical protein
LWLLEFSILTVFYIIFGIVIFDTAGHNVRTAE